MSNDSIFQIHSPPGSAGHRTGVVVSNPFRAGLVGLTLLGASTLGAGMLGGTTVIALRTGGGIVIGADSRLNRLGKDGAIHVVHDRACKVIEVDGAVFAQAGLQPDGIDVFERARLIMHGRGRSPREMAEVFRKAVWAPLLADLRQWYKAIPGGLQGRVTGMSFLFAKGTGDDVALTSMNLAGVVTDAGVSELTVHEREDWPDGKPRNMTLLGKGGDFILAVMRAENIRVDTVPIAETMVPRWIRLAAADPSTMNQVGGPVDVVTVTPSGTRWVHQKDNCK